MRRALRISVGKINSAQCDLSRLMQDATLTGRLRELTVNKPTFLVNHSAASLALLLFLGFPAAFFSTGARNFPV